jgi:glyoxylase-like metal-dependent hydrolase (beta-lactamase superfamily II)
MTAPQTLDLGYGISCIDTGLNGRVGAGACYLIREGDAAAFVDTGTFHAVPGLLAVLEQQGIAPGQVQYVCPTHVHTDHGGGAGELMRHLSNATLIAHPRAAPHFIDPSKIREGAAAVYGEVRFKELFGEIVAIPAKRVQETPDGLRLSLNGRELIFMDTPGHARHHYCIWDEKSRGVFTGDTFGLSYREFDTANGPYLMPTTTPVQFEPDAWYTTLDRLLGLEPRRMYLTHYGCVEEIGKLAADLRHGLAAYVELARRHADDINRHEVLKQSLTALALRELRAHGCTLDEACCLDILETDLELNTQGLEVWLDRQKTRSSQGRQGKTGA